MMGSPLCVLRMILGAINNLHSLQSRYFFVGGTMLHFLLVDCEFIPWIAKMKILNIEQCKKSRLSPHGIASNRTL